MNSNSKLDLNAQNEYKLFKPAFFKVIWQALHPYKSFSLPVQTLETLTAYPDCWDSSLAWITSPSIIDLKATTHIFLLGWHYSYYISPISQSLGPAPSDCSRQLPYCQNTSAILTSPLLFISPEKFISFTWFSLLLKCLPAFFRADFCMQDVVLLPLYKTISSLGTHPLCSSAMKSSLSLGPILITVPVTNPANGWEYRGTSWPQL